MASAVRAFVNSPTGPRTTHFWGPVANWGFVLAVRAMTRRRDFATGGGAIGPTTTTTVVRRGRGARVDALWWRVRRRRTGDGGRATDADDADAGIGGHEKGGG